LIFDLAALFWPSPHTVFDTLNSKKLASDRIWAHDSLGGANSRLKDLTAMSADDEAKLSYWQLIFLQSRANGCLYNVGDLRQANWQWPKDTYLT